MTITTTANTDSNITEIIIASSILDDLVAGTYSTIRVRLKACDGTTYDIDPILAADVTVVADADDTYTILPTVISGTTTEFPFDYFIVEIYTGLLYDTLADTGSVLTNTELECKVYTYLLNCPDSKLYITYQAIKNAQACDTCNCDVLKVAYTNLLLDLEKTCSVTTNCNC